MRVLVVDDEEPARRRLGRMLRELAGVEVVGEPGTPRRRCGRWARSGRTC
ncbi:hypothetical protein ACLESO_20240 [Pyxidicoccus sp. 3LG]